MTLPLGDRLRLEIDGPPLEAADQRVLMAFAAHAAVLIEQRRLLEVELAARRSAETDRVRTALLAAVSHDLRTPLAAAKTAVNGLLDPAVEWLPSQRQELLETADESLDRLTRLVDDLLDLSRLQAGVLPVVLEPVCGRGCRHAGAGQHGRDGGRHPGTTCGDGRSGAAGAGARQSCPERVAVRRGSRLPPHLTARQNGAFVECAIVDHGPGIPAGRREQAFTAFQRLGDRGTEGVGLGLAIARGLTVAMGGTLRPDDTPGGGLTMVVSLPVAGAR